ncbi:CaiB/BaiF CoA transferase family protein [Nocardia mexicana]|uniref:Crotonobetainyl-CoA:carnitine CoA-transferase CaiB-like acyl-CoA transferase n=1 Tax=Nocardia mexicana TaxID=279262 RepID=A0A370H8T3_9NOCA|nr:CoA transferase [Nocardia mexicana]RDI53067.1 crotonobetainyl-CoA:carnitine CoA-transferase CaiB-like acyl-CoA transferase [Nocardia mexicana]
MSSSIDLGGPATGPLRGVTVIDLSTVVMGPMAGQILGDFGADVIRVEPPFDTARISPGGMSRTPGMAPLYLQNNRNKRNVALNLKDPEDRAALFDLLDDADVLLTNMRAGALERLGLGYEQIRERFPHLVYAHAQGFNAQSSQAGRPAYDEVIQAVTGLVNLHDRAAGSVQFLPTFIADKTAGLYLLAGLLAALYHQARTGEGQLVSLAMADAMIAINLVEHLAGEVFSPPTGPVGNPMSLEAEHVALRTADGGAISAIPYTNADVRTLLIGAGCTELAADPCWDAEVTDREQRRVGVRAVIANSTTRTTAEWTDYLTANDMPFGVVVDIADLPDDPYVREVGLIEEVEHPTEGRMKVVTNPAHFSKTPTNIRRLAERAGDSNDEVLARRSADSAA